MVVAICDIMVVVQVTPPSPLLTPLYHYQLRWMMVVIMEMAMMVMVEV